MNKKIIINRVAKILTETPSAQDIVKKGKGREKRFEYLAKQMVNKAIAEDALVTAGDDTGIAILFKTSKKKKNFWSEMINDLKLVYHVTGVKNALKILKNQNYIKSLRPDKGEYLYCWFWGVDKSTRGNESKVAHEMRDEFLRRADMYNIPLYAETRIRKNMIVYQRYGFELFHTWDRPEGDKMWFLRYVPEALKSQNN
ncbi:MAG: hypothetical protein ACTJGD_10265 [Mesonia hippocampi]|uniref:hypothetical protein n=1 Tax=Mesonia hippocampi TaxID=1628250 RepID=UPI003F9A5825